MAGQKAVQRADLTDVHLAEHLADSMVDSKVGDLADPRAVRWAAY